VLTGRGGPKLLDAYGAERRPIAVRNSSFSTHNFANWLRSADFSMVLDPGPEADAARATIGKEMGAALQQEWHSPGVGLGYRYEGSPLIVPDGTPEPADTVETYLQTARPGHRAPHAWLADGRSTIDLFGRGFVLLRFQTVDVTPLVEAASARGVALRVIDIDDPAIASLYERALVLVRPDAHVCWRNDALPDDCAALIGTVAGFA
jgi:hypothetical protein